MRARNVEMYYDRSGKLIVLEHPRTPAVTLLRLAEIRADLLHRTALARLHVGAQDEYNDPSIFRAVADEKNRLAAVLEKYR